MSSSPTIHCVRNAREENDNRQNYIYIFIPYILSSSLAIVCVRNARGEGDNRQVLPFVPIQSIPKASQIPTSCCAKFFLQLCTEVLCFCTASSSNTSRFVILPSSPFQNNFCGIALCSKVLNVLANAAH